MSNAHAPQIYRATSRESRIYKALREEYPGSISAKQLMSRIGLSWRTDPARSFTLLCISFSNLTSRLSARRFQAVRTGGTPDDSYRLTLAGGG